MNKQTALQWLIGYYYDNEGAIGIKQLEKAEQMEKEQIINANRDGVDMVVDKKDFISGEQYYNETFNTTKTSTHGGLTSLDEHNSNAWSTQVNMYSNEPRPNGIACPKCGNELMDTNPMMTLTSHPAKKDVHCPKCEYKGYRYENL